MNLYFDNVAFYLQRIGGVTTYWYEILTRIMNSNSDLWLIENKSSHANFYRSKLKFDSERLIFEKLPVVISRYLPIFLPKLANGIFHSSYYRYCVNDKVANIITVYDFMYEYFQKGIKKNIHSFQKNWAINKADGIICISESTKRDLVSFNQNINEKKIKIIHLGVDQGYFKLPNALASNYNHLSALISGKYILFVSYRGGYKNFNLVIETLELLEDFNLILVGGGDLSTEEKNILKNKLGKRYAHIKMASNTDLNILYNFAFCLLYPSSYEGFGIPIVEAMKAGCPVICNSTSSIPEVAGNAGIMIGNIDKHKVVKKIRELENQSYREKVIILGYEQSSKFSWDKTYSQTMEFYDEVYANKFGHDYFS